MSLALAAPAAVVAQTPQAAAPFVFDHVTVINIETGERLPEQRVVVVGNHIQAVGGVDAVQLPKGSQVVDARGKYLIPGLWDMHYHTSDDISYPLVIANGVTGIRDAWTGFPLKTQVQWWHEILAGTRVGPPRMLLSGMALRGPVTTDLEGMERIIDSLKAEGATFIKVYPFNFEKAAAARRAGLPFGGHLVEASGVGMYEDGNMEAEDVPGGELDTPSAIEAADSGMRIFDHLGSANMFGYCFSVKAEASLEKCQPIADQFRKKGSWLVPTLLADTWGKRYAVLLDSLMNVHVAAFQAGAPAFRGNWLRDSVHGGPPRFPGWSPDGYFDILRRVDMPLLAGTDAITRYTGDPFPGFSLHAELAAFVAESLTTPLGALQAATLNPAKLIHGTDSLGTVAPGKLADLVLLDADPLEDITNTTTIRAVVANGRYFDRAALDKLLLAYQAEYQARKRATPP